MIRRREFITLLGGAAVAWPDVARAQQAERKKRIGWLDGTGDDPETRARLTAFRQRLQTLGWIEGRNVEIIARFRAADPDQNRTYVAELLGLVPDVIVSTNPPSISALMKETRTIPIVFPIMSDPVALGFAESLARPGGNVTGFTHFEPVTATKWLELLREVAPGVNRIATLVDPRNSTGDMYVHALEAAAASLSLPFTTARARDGAEIEQAISSFARESNGGLVLPPGPLQAVHRELIVKLAARHRLPAVYPWRYMVVDGGLISYGPDVLEMYRGAATYVDRILKGEQPAELPVQASTKFELVINLKTAKALGLEVPPTLLARADEVIE
jgi:putative tryptophan/tyrosine transport system substrate-binding protein